MPGDIVIAATAIVAKENAEATVSDVVALVSTITNELQGDFDDDYEEEMPAPKEKKLDKEKKIARNRKGEKEKKSQKRSG